MSTSRRKDSGGLLSRISAGMTSFAGITAALATITTSTTAILGVVVHHQAAQLHQANQTVAVQQQQIHELQTRSSPVAAVSPAPTPSSGGGVAVGNVAHYLSNMTPTVDNAGIGTGQEVIAAKPYVNSISFGCSGSSGDQPDEAYNVAGSSLLSAEVGIADNSSNATDVIATVTFSNESGQQIGNPVQVSLGHPAKLSLDIGGVTQLGMTCTGRDRRTSEPAYGFEVTLGNAGIS
jgi:hypothetical protein